MPNVTTLLTESSQAIHFAFICFAANLNINLNFGCRYLEILNASIFSLVFIVLNVRDGIESKTPSCFSEYI